MVSSTELSFNKHLLSWYVRRCPILLKGTNSSLLRGWISRKLSNRLAYWRKWDVNYPTWWCLYSYPSKRFAHHAMIHSIVCRWLNDVALLIDFPLWWTEIQLVRESVRLYTSRTPNRHQAGPAAGSQSSDLLVWHNLSSILWVYRWPNFWEGNGAGNGSHIG